MLEICPLVVGLAGNGRRQNRAADSGNRRLDRSLGGTDTSRQIQVSVVEQVVRFRAETPRFRALDMGVRSAFVNGEVSPVQGLVATRLRLALP